jgi:hypothetical protein
VLTRKKDRRRTIVGSLALITLIVAALAWRASWISHRLLRSWAAATIHEKSGAVYRLDVGRIRFNIALRRITVDSMLVTTNDSANTARAHPLATLGIVFRDCRISGIHVGKLIRNRGFVAGDLGCKVVNARFVVPPGTPDTIAGSEQPLTLREMQQRIALPSFAPMIKVAHVDFPDVKLDFHIQRAKGAKSRVQLDHFRWRMTGFDLDPSNAVSALRPIFSKTIELAADSLVFFPDSNMVLRVSSVFASLTDSTLDVKGVSYRPALGRAAHASRKPYRRKYTTTRVASIAARGVDVRALFLGRGLRARSVTLDSLMLDVTNDHILPVKPGAKPRRRTPQQWIADLNTLVRVDSVLLQRGRVEYRLRRPERKDFGLITFGRINALALGVNTGPSGAATRAPLRLSFTTQFQDSARLTAHFAVPLRGRRFDMTYRGTLGPMSAGHLNQFVEATTPMRIVRGEVVGIEFGATVSNGLTLGTVTPRYNNLTFAVNQEGSNGLKGRNGFFGSIARTVASFAVNWKGINAGNPGDPRNTPQAGKIHHPFRTEEALVDYIWYGLRDGLADVLRK